MKPMKVAFIGVGAISGIYLENLTKTFQDVEILGVCDLIRERAEKAVEQYSIPKLYETMYDAFADPEVDVILNLTRPYEHFDVSKEALKAGKHVYSEKPLAATLEEGRILTELAQEKGLMLGGAPDTYLGAGIQTCRKLIDDGFIGEPVGAAAFMICRGHETWHPDPELYYKHGGGPLMDMGPYYLTALINLLGGVSAVTGAARKSFPQRIITSQPKSGQVIDVDVPTYTTGILHFESGAIGTIFTTFDVYYETQARLEIYGSKGTLIVPDPNGFGGPVKLFRPEQGGMMELPLMFDYRENSRGLGLEDMARALQTGRPFRSSWQQTLHVLEIMETIHQSSQERRTLELASSYQRQLPMENNPIHGMLD